MDETAKESGDEVASVDQEITSETQQQITETEEEEASEDATTSGQSTTQSQSSFDAEKEFARLEERRKKREAELGSAYDPPAAPVVKIEEITDSGHVTLAFSEDMTVISDLELIKSVTVTD